MCNFAANFNENQKMTITEDDSNVYIEDYVIPKGREKADIKARENVQYSITAIEPVE